MDINDLYQIVLVVSAVAGYLGAGAFLAQTPWLPSPLAWILAPFLGYTYGEIQAAILCRFPRVREWGVVSTSGFCKVGCPYFMLLLLWGTFTLPFLRKAREISRAAGRLPPELPSWMPLAAMAFPIVLSGIIAVAGW